MQVRFRTRQLQRCYESHQDAARQWGAAVARRYVQRINTLQAVESLEDLRRIPPLRFHPLKGSRAGQYAITLIDRARLTITFSGKTTTIVWIEEVSKHYGD